MEQVWTGAFIQDLDCVFSEEAEERMVGTRISVGGKIRESGMPPEEDWSSFFDIEKILDDMKISSGVRDVADFACGYGTFTIPAAQRIRGIMFAIDIDPQMIRRVDEKSSRLGLVNVKPMIRNLLYDGSGLRNGSVDYVMLFNILHTEDPVFCPARQSEFSGAEDELA